MNTLPLFLPGDVDATQDVQLTPENQANLEALAELGSEGDSAEEEARAPIKDMEQLQSLENKERKKKEEQMKAGRNDDAGEVHNAESDSEEVGFRFTTVFM